MSARQDHITIPQIPHRDDPDHMVDVIIVSDEDKLGNAPPSAVAIVALVCFGIGLLVGATLL